MTAASRSTDIVMMADGIGVCLRRSSGLYAAINRQEIGQWAAKHDIVTAQ